eukprot:537585-Prorocentrum_minimum.AAC.1
MYAIAVVEERDTPCVGLKVYSHNRPIRRRKRGYILTIDQSDAGSGGIFSQYTNQTQEAGTCGRGFGFEPPGGTGFNFEHPGGRGFGFEHPGGR